MKVTYDPWADAVYIYFASKTGNLNTMIVDNSLMVDIDANDRVFGVEILDASSRLDLEELKTLEFMECGPPTPYEPSAERVTIHEQRSHHNKLQEEGDVEV